MYGYVSSTLFVRMDSGKQQTRWKAPVVSNWCKSCAPPTSTSVSISTKFPSAKTDSLSSSMVDQRLPLATSKVPCH